MWRGRRWSCSRRYAVMSVAMVSRSGRWRIGMGCIVGRWQALENAVPPERKTPVRTAPKLEPAKPLIDAMLTVDLTALASSDTPRGGCWPGDVSDSYQGVGDVRWLVCHVDAVTDGQALLAAAVEQMRRWGKTAVSADCALPAPGCYGIPDTMPHLRAVLTEASFGEPTRTRASVRHAAPAHVRNGGANWALRTRVTVDPPRRRHIVPSPVTGPSKISNYHTRGT